MIYDKNEDPDPNMNPEMLERQSIINQLMERLDGVCIVGFYGVSKCANQSFAKRNKIVAP